MRESVRTVGFVLTVMGVSGTIDHLDVQPIMGVLLNAFNRYVFPNIAALAGYELYANLAVVVVGFVVMVSADRIPAT